MALELIGSLFVAIALGLMVWALRRWFPGLPKWLVPASAGLGLIGATVYLEYDWFDRVSAALPPGFVVVNAEATSNPLQPWTYLAPITTSFTVLDSTKLVRHPKVATLVTAPVFGFARWQSPRNTLVVFDCAFNRRTPVTETTQIDDAGQLTAGEWVALETRDELQEAACREG